MRVWETKSWKPLKHPMGPGRKNYWRKASAGEWTLGRFTYPWAVPKGSVHEFRNLADEGQALIMLKRRMGVLGIKESDLKAKTKGAVEKQVLAWR